jgi:hypothetical protein
LFNQYKIRFSLTAAIAVHCAATGLSLCIAAPSPARQRLPAPRQRRLPP